MIANLKAHYDEQTVADFTALQDVCDSSQDRASLVLMQLQQRMITSGSFNNIYPPPLDPDNALNRISTIPTAKKDIASSSLRRKSVTASGVEIEVTSEFSRSPSPSSAPHAPAERLSPSQLPPRLESSLSRTSMGSYDTATTKNISYKPMATTVSKTGLFGIVRRTKVEPVISPPENPLVDEYLADALEENAQRVLQGTSINAPESSVHEPIHQTQSTWQDLSPSSLTDTPARSESTLSFDSVYPFSTVNEEAPTTNRSSLAMNAKSLLPNEMNKYAGFCKGAWRQQIGDTARAMEARIRPGGMYNQAKYWQCKQCKFEGRLVPIDKKRSGYDRRVFKLVGMFFFSRF